jgi:hypothetical protein
MRIDGTGRDSTDARNALLRIRRSQVRVLPSASQTPLFAGVFAETPLSAWPTLPYLTGA